MMLATIGAAAGPRGIEPRPAPILSPAATPAETRPSGGASVSAVGETQTADAVLQAASRALDTMYENRQVDVQSYYDESAGRAVYRVADRNTGEVLVETPPEALLRFFASTREQAGSPLVTLEA